MQNQLFISVVVPVYNGAAHLGRCLDALLASRYKEFEIIVSDDASTDASAAVSIERGIICVRGAVRSGPAAARNAGAKCARGEILFFVDSDVLVQPDTLAHVARIFTDSPDTDAAFGSYDDAPFEPDFASQYKNLFHHYVHQHSPREATTFWGACGAIRRAVFEHLGGFDARQYNRPCIEDIELGFRLRADNHRVVLDKDLQVKHLKRWTIANILRTDIYDRAVPWSQLLLQSGRLVNELNLQTPERVSAACTGLAVLSLLLTPFEPRMIYLFIVTLAVVLFLNRHLYLFFLKRRGAAFTLGAILMHLLYYIYSGVTFVLLWLRQKLTGNRARVRRAES